MNHIVEEEEKKDILTPHIEDGYKVIYPNKSVKIELVRTYADCAHSYIKTGLTCSGLKFKDRLTTYKNNLFLKPGNFEKGTSRLTISRDGAKVTFPLERNVAVYDSSNKYLGSEIKFPEKIEYILFKQGEVTNRLRIITDKEFKTKSAQKYERIQNAKKKLEEELDLDLS